jgi:Tol biopolymer transport system component
MPQVVAAGWGAPVKLTTLNTACPEDAIEISRDGSTLYFYWSPTVGASADELLNGTTGTYYASRVGSDPGSFANPRFFDLRRDAAGGASDGELSFMPAGDQVYFHSTRAANTGYTQQPSVDDFLDIYVATISGGRPGAAQNLGPAVNSVYPDGEHCLSPDGTRLYLSSQRPGGLGDADIWLSTKAGSLWNAPVNLGAPINSAGADLQPAFAASDPTTMYFVSDRGGAAGIYRSTLQGATWSQPEPVITGYVGEPSLVADGSVLYFVHVLVDGGGVFGADIWYVRKTN